QILPSDFSIVLLIIIVPVMTFLLLKDGYYLKKSILQILPNRYFEVTLYLIQRLKEQLSNWAKKQLLIAIIIGSLSIVAFYLLDISNYISIGILVGLAHLIPYFGPFVGAIIAITLTVLTADSLKLVIAVIIALATVKLLYNLLLSPIIKNHSIELHPLIILLIMLIGSYVWGILGLLLFVPIATIFVIMFREFYFCMRQYNII
ncbi:AI-2E family transporter, partial [candidate division KSB1 bacterium]|nr:AI-2E family transporter [candidate division KSB1 bacterium]